MDLDLADQRSAAGRLPADEIDWLRCTGAVLFGARHLLGALVSGLARGRLPRVVDSECRVDCAAFLVMEYVRGRDLRAMLRAEGPMTPDRMAAVPHAIAGPVDAAHILGVLHRDLKPENILLPDSGDGAKVLDIGVAKLRAGVDPTQRPASATAFAISLRA